MLLQEEDLAPEVLRTVLRVLTGDPSPSSLRRDGALLYLCSGRADFVRQMPSFDEWGLHPAGFTGLRENPAAMVARPVVHSGPSSGDRAGRRESAGAEATGVEVPMPREALKAAPPEARPGAAAGAELRPSALEAGAPEAPAVPREAMPDGVPQAGSFGVDILDASSVPQADPCVGHLGRFRVDFEALCKRKEALGGDDHPCRLLKRRKYFAMDE